MLWSSRLVKVFPARTPWWIQCFSLLYRDKTTAKAARKLLRTWKTRASEMTSNPKTKPVATPHWRLDCFDMQTNAFFPLQSIFSSVTESKNSHIKVTIKNINHLQHWIGTAKALPTAQQANSMTTATPQLLFKIVDIRRELSPVLQTSTVFSHTFDVEMLFESATDGFTTPRSKCLWVLEEITENYFLFSLIWCRCDAETLQQARKDFPCNRNTSLVGSKYAILLPTAVSCRGMALIVKHAFHAVPERMYRFSIHWKHAGNSRTCVCATFVDNFLSYHIFLVSVCFLFRELLRLLMSLNLSYIVSI